jgi:hypothetical protein
MQTTERDQGSGHTLDKLSSQKLLTGDLHFDVIKAISMISSFLALFPPMTTLH